jgi:outer membrane immunogenic protein
MRRTFAILCAFAGLSGSAFAADLPPSPPPRAPAAYVPAVLPVYNWSGFYIGINGGWGWASGTITDTVTSGPLAGLTGTSSGNINGGIFWRADWCKLPNRLFGAWN